MQHPTHLLSSPLLTMSWGILELLEIAGADWRKDVFGTTRSQRLVFDFPLLIYSSFHSRPIRPEDSHLIRYNLLHTP